MTYETPVLLHLYLKSIRLKAEDLYLWLKQTQMKNLLLFGALALCLNSYGQPTLSWANGFGNTGSDVANEITTDTFGNVYTTGNFRGTVDFDPGVGIFNLTSNGNADFFIQKLDANGAFLWAISTGGSSTDGGESITTDALGNIYTTGYFAGTVDFDPGAGVFNLTALGSTNVFIQKLDVNGNLIWAKSIEGMGNSLPHSITIDISGNIYSTGLFNGTIDVDLGPGIFNLTSNGGSDIYIQKMSTDGIFLWAKSTGGNGNDVGNSITTDALGNIYTTGYFSNTVDFDPGPGIFNLSSSSLPGFIQKLDSNGSFVWAKMMTSTGGCIFNSITSDGYGNIYVSGYFGGFGDFDPGLGIFNLLSNGATDGLIIKLDANGSFIWAKNIGGSGLDYVWSIKSDFSGNVYSTGYFQGTVDFDPNVGNFSLMSNGLSDIFVLKLDSTGSFEWASSFGGPDGDAGFAITKDISENVYVTGRFAATADFDPGPGLINLSSNGLSDIFNLKLIECIVTNSTDTQSACDSYTWIDGNTYTTSNNSATYTTNNAAGCDSTVTLNLTITNSTSSTDTQSACDSYTWIDGNTYTTSNNSATYTTNNAAGCDSTVTLNLTITNSTSSTDTQSACDSYTWIDGNTYTTSNNSATYTTNNAAGCDSTVTLNLTISPTPDNSITQNGASLTATQTGATYQWIDCDNFNAPITGEVNQTFFPSSTGNYAVEVTIGDCSSTSECRLVDFTGIDEIESLISVHPNPTKDEVTLSIGAELLGTGFVVTDNAGRIVLSDTFKSTKQTVNLTRFDNGVYFIRTDKESPVKIIKQ